MWIIFLYVESKLNDFWPERPGFQHSLLQPQTSFNKNKNLGSFGLPIFSKIDSETFLVQFFSRPIPRFVGTNLYLKTSSKTSWFQILRHRFQSSILSTTNWKDPRTLCLVKVLLMGRIFISKVEIQAGSSCAMHQKWARSIFEDKNAEPDKSPGKPSLLCVYFEKLLHGDVDCDNSGSG